MKSIQSVLIVAAALASSSPAFAQKSDDTLRVAVNNPFTELSPYQAPLDEASFYYNRVFESLIARDEHAGKWVPQLAKSWTRVNETTLDFDLRDNVQFHNGNKFDADDVVATFNYVRDPNVTLPNKDRYTWVKDIEKLGPYKVRITAIEPTALDLALIAYRYSIFDKETMDGLADKTEYGRVSPVGTGVYKVTLLDKNKGVIVERNDAFTGDKAYARASVKRAHGIFLPDRQTQIAELITGGVDVMVNVEPGQASDLKSRPNVDVVSLSAGAMTYLALDASGKAGNKALMDPKVREAIFMAINRDAINKYIIPGGESSEHLDIPCFATMIACTATKKPPAYDPERAKKLLAEAGYPDGFDMTYDIYTPLKDIAVAISGDLLKIGVRATVAPMNIQIYRKKQNDFSMQAWSFLAPIGQFPDASAALELWFQGTRAGYFNEDPPIMDAAKAGAHEMDPAKRTALYRDAFDRVTEMHYVMPIAAIPGVYAVSKDIQILDDQRSASVRGVSDFAFK